MQETLIAPDPTPTIAALARCRRNVLERANALLGADASVLDAPAGPVPEIVRLLMTSLEELKAVEEELRESNTRLLTQRLAADDRLCHYRALFEHAPVPAIVTDLYGSIHEINAAAGRLFRREAHRLERRALSSLLVLESREEFRVHLLRHPLDDTPREWPLVLSRMGDRPLPVRAVVHLVPGIGPTGSGMLYWVLHREPQREE